MKYVLLLTLALLAAPTVAFAQDEASAEECAPEALNLDAGTDLLAQAEEDAMPANAAARTDAELRVQDTIQEDGVHVVHFWAPWCSNSIGELRAGWDELVEAHPEVTFTFVTIWNDGESARATMDEHNLSGRVVELTQPDFGPSDDKSQRRRTFLDLPVTWIPTTMIFHQNGELAFSMNYGEMDMDTLGRLIEITQQDW